MFDIITEIHVYKAYIEQVYIFRNLLIKRFNITRYSMRYGN